MVSATRLGSLESRKDTFLKGSSPRRYWGAWNYEKKNEMSETSFSAPILHWLTYNRLGSAPFGSARLGLARLGSAEHLFLNFAPHARRRPINWTVTYIYIYIYIICICICISSHYDPAFLYRSHSCTVEPGAVCSVPELRCS